MFMNVPFAKDIFINILVTFSLFTETPLKIVFRKIIIFQKYIFCRVVLKITITMKTFEKKWLGKTINQVRFQQKSERFSFFVIYDRKLAEIYFKILKFNLFWEGHKIWNSINLTLFRKTKIIWDFFQFFLVFSEYMNFTNM